MVDPSSICVLTTSERMDLFRAAVGADADFWLDPLKTDALADFLCNALGSGGRVVVLDEEHFVTADVMCSGLQRFLDEPAYNAHRLRIIVVCSRRKAGEPLLSFLAMYCGIYDVLYDVDGPELSVRLQRLVAHPNRRSDVLELVTGTLAGSATWQQSPWQEGSGELVVSSGQRATVKFSIEIQNCN